MKFHTIWLLLVISTPVSAQIERLMQNLPEVAQSGIFVENPSSDAENEDLARYIQFQRADIAQVDFIELEERSKVSNRPPLNAGRIIGEIGAGVAFGGLFGLAGGMAGYQLEREFSNCSYDLCGLLGFMVGGAIGYTIGSATGVSLVGNIGNETGPFRAALGGSIGGSLLVVAGIAILSRGNVQLGETLSTLAVILAFAAPPVGAMIAFNNNRRYEIPPAPGQAMIDFSKGPIELAPTSVSSRPELYIDLVKVKF
jgi:hypothetical protein